MKIDLVAWMLLLFGASLSSGHYIRQADKDQSLDNSNVYAVQDGSSGITFVNPKQEKPTLREILYYHVIERERGKHVVTERSFTNSHGYQFSEQPSSDEDHLPYDEEEHDDEYLHNENDQSEENDHEEADDFLRAIIKDQDTEDHDDEEPESSAKPSPLTNEDVKEAYKARNYLFDQMRQKYAVKRMVDSLHRKKREAELEPLPDAPKLSDDEDKAARMQPNTFGMNIKPEGGYVWNNLNKPPTYYELGASNGNPNEGQDESQGQENLPPGENNYYPTEQQSTTDNPEATDENPEPNDDADDLSDICVDINKPCALPLGNLQTANADNPENLESNDSGTNPNSNESIENSDDGAPNYTIGSVAFENIEPVESVANSQPDPPNTYGMSLTSGGGHVWNDLVNPTVSYEVGSSNENPEPNNNEATYPVEPIIGGDILNKDSESNDGAAVYPMETEISDNPGLVANPEPNESGVQESEMPQAENPISEGVAEPAGSNENIGSGYEESQQEPGPESTPVESSEGEKLMEIPDAPTLPPLNYDNLQGYINGATDGPASYGQTDNPYMNPQVYPEDTKAKEENMESILVTMQPVEDIPQTYGMNLTSDGGHVWNTLVNPPVSYDVGSSNENPEPIYQNPKPNDSEANSPAKPAIVDDTSNSDSASNEGATYPQGSEAFENPDGGHVGNTVVNPAVSYDIGSNNEPSESVTENNNSEHAGESNESYGSGNQGSQSEEQKPENTPEESAEGEKPKEPIWRIPEAPTLPPLNYDNLPDYIRNSLSSTENPGYYEHTENPYTNPQTDPEDKKTMEDKMEDIFATMKPAEDEPNKTYGMSLNSDGGHVWNDMVNPPISYDVGSPSPSEEKHIEEPAPALESNEQPGSHESEEANNPTQEPANPEKELEEPIANHENPEPGPQIPETEDSKPIEEPAQQVEPGEPETAEIEKPEVTEPSEESQEEQDVEPVEPKPEEGNVKPDIMNELLKSEQFWKWLGVWTATYMELLEKHIRKIAIQEICNHQKIGNQMCFIDEYPEDSGVIMKDEKIVVDNKEMDLTHTDNFDKELKRGNHNPNNHNKGTNGNKIEASTIYGNSVGNEKVTNVFIFTADKADQVIDKLKPTNNSEIDFIIDERIKEEKNKDENKTPNEEASNVGELDEDEVSKEGPNKELNKEESNEGDVNSEEISNEEANKEESIEIEPNMDSSNTEDANKEASGNNEEIEKQAANNEESFEGETNNKEEANKKGPTDNEPNEEELNKKEDNKEASIQSDSKEGNLNKEAANKDESKEDKAKEEELNKEGANKGEANDEELNKEENNKKESIASEANEDIKETSKEELDAGAANEEELNKEEAKQDKRNEELNKNKD